MQTMRDMWGHEGNGGTCRHMHVSPRVRETRSSGGTGSIQAPDPHLSPNCPKASTLLAMASFPARGWPCDPPPPVQGHLTLSCAHGLPSPSKHLPVVT